MSRADVPRPTLDPETLDPSQETGGVPAGPPKKPLGITPDGRLKAGRLAGLTLGGAIWVLSWPVMVESFLNSLVGLTDTKLAAEISEATTDAVGVATYALWFAGLVIMALGIGSTAVISRSIGKRRMAVASRALGQSILLAGVSGVVLGIVMWITAPAFGKMMNMEGEALGTFITYIRIVSYGIPFETVLFVGIACGRGAGYNQAALWTMVVRNIVNMVLSFSLSGVDLTSSRVDGGVMARHVVLENPFGLEWGVRGIAWGTVCSDVTGAVIILCLAGGGGWGIRLTRRRLRPHWHTLRRIVRVGLPNFFETLGMWFGNVLVLMLVGLLGSPGLFGAHALAIRVEAFSFLPGFSMGIACATLAGQYLGAGSPELARRAILVCTGVSCAIMGIASVLLLTIPLPLVGLLSSQPTHLRESPGLLMLAGCVQIPFAISIVFRQALRGVGDVKAVMWITWVTTYALRLPLAFFLCGADIPLPGWAGGGVIENPSPVRWGLWGLWLGLCLEITIRAALFTWRFFQGRWVHAKV